MKVKVGWRTGTTQLNFAVLLRCWTLADKSGTSTLSAYSLNFDPLSPPDNACCYINKRLSPNIFKDAFVRGYNYRRQRNPGGFTNNRWKCDICVKLGTCAQWLLLLHNDLTRLALRRTRKTVDRSWTSNVCGLCELSKVNNYAAPDCWRIIGRGWARLIPPFRRHCPMAFYFTGTNVRPKKRKSSWLNFMHKHLSFWK